MASGLKCLQWLARGVQLAASAVVLGITSYSLASLLRAGLAVPTSVKAVEGISAAAAVYTALGVLLACCCCCRCTPLALLTAAVDVGLAAAFVYVAVANRGGASACAGDDVGTVYGSGAASATPAAGGGGDGSGVLGLPTYGMACRLETACLAAACVAILFFLVTILLAFSPSHHRNRDRGASGRRDGPRHVDGDGEYFAKSPMYDTRPSPYANTNTNNHHAAAAAAAGAMPAPPQRAGLLGGLFRRQNTYRGAVMEQQQQQQHPDALPAHQQPSDVATRRWEEEQVPVWGEVVSLGGGREDDNDELFFNEARDVDEGGAPVRFTPTTAPRPAAERYEEGEVPAERAERGYDMYGWSDDAAGAREGAQVQGARAGGQRDLAETSGRGLGRHRESREARMERFAVG